MLGLADTDAVGAAIGVFFRAENDNVSPDGGADSNGSKVIAIRSGDGRVDGQTGKRARIEETLSIRTPTHEGVYSQSIALPRLHYSDSSLKQMDNMKNGDSLPTIVCAVLVRVSGRVRALQSNRQRIDWAISVVHDGAKWAVTQGSEGAWRSQFYTQQRHNARCSRMALWKLNWGYDTLALILVPDPSPRLRCRPPALNAHARADDSPQFAEDSHACACLSP
ncbi:hypothetical protein EVG20_g3876 [Dentipellis fragilis]|uniref:Uncharacterized protein n=1 Tax=Dentipellis fragilis TaxID=205917 RepID=A0A4Y9YYE8_9AGAM|nr:hypothetical protein EVG20_g3876 [Dentipellis fragilis]